MLRFNSQNMDFQVIDSSVGPSCRDEHGRSHFTRGGVRQENTTELPDGCGSLVLVDTKVPRDRAMIFCIRPPWLVGKKELYEFVQAAVSVQSSLVVVVELRDNTECTPVAPLSASRIGPAKAQNL